MDLCQQSDNTLSRSVITFLPRSKHLLILWLQSQSAVILEPKKIKSVTVSTVSSSICHEVMEPEAIILVCFFFYCWVLGQLFHSLFHPQEALEFLFAFCHWSCIICIHEVVDTSSNLGSSLWVIQPSLWLCPVPPLQYGGSTLAGTRCHLFLPGGEVQSIELRSK